MKVWLLRAGTVLALALLIFSFTNASWLADMPRGHVRQLAMGGIKQYSLGTGDCAAAAIEPPVHDYLANTLTSLSKAKWMSASVVAVDVAVTADGRIVAFGSDRLDCLTDGKGPVRAKTLAQLSRLDAGYGYSADGGRSFPLRGRGVGAIPTLEDMLKVAQDMPLLYRFTSDSPEDGDFLIKALKTAGRDVEARGDGFYGPSAPVARVRAQFPKAWFWDEAAAADCSSSYVLYGWSGITPASCKGGTIVIPLDRQWQFWGWPNRLIARMKAAGGRIVLTGPTSDGMEKGLSLPEQIPEVPASFNGYLQEADIWTVGAALHSSADHRAYMEAKRGRRGPRTAAQAAAIGRR